MQLLLLSVVLLVSIDNVIAAPTVGSSEMTTRALHPCSVEIQRWCTDCEERFDTYYYNAYPTSPFNWPVTPWWTQTSLNINTPGAGSELVPIQVGSNVLHIVDYAEPTNGDLGKLTFVWGSQSWDSFSPGNPCEVVPSGTISQAIEYQCNYQCDK